ncbi:hypothetical protein JXO59_03145 [candidate division KSB1 bacterium]|nr:hypothetical protein [candidate division KSB1 bacterium]
MKLQPKLFHIFLVLALVLALSTSVFAQQGTIVARKTADPLTTGYAKWIKIQIKGPTETNNNLNDQFSGMEFTVDLNYDGDYNDATNVGDVVTVNGSEIVTNPPGVPGGNNDDTIYLPIKSGTSVPSGYYDTNLRPRVWLKNAGALRIGPFGLSISIDSGYFPCDDGITPMIRYAYYYDDGSGSSTAGTGHVGNVTPFDGYIDRIDLIWSEPMDSSNITVNAAIFQGLVGATIHSFETIGTWYYNIGGRARRFTLWLRSSQPNTGIAPIMMYQKPASVTDRFREAVDSQNKAYAESHSRALTDRAGPAIISARTKRAMRRQPLANALTSKRIEVTFSEPVARSSVQTTDFQVFTSVTSPATNDISSIISPTGAGSASAVYEFQLTTNFANGNETGTIRYIGDRQVTDVLGNFNGESTADTPPTRPSPDPGATVNITDGIFPIITHVHTIDAVLPAQLGSGGMNDWGYLDYVDVYFDHDMNTARVSTAGLLVTGNGILTIGGTGTWVSSMILRVPLTTTTPKIPNTGVIPQVSYTNPGHPNGLVDAVNAGLAENLLTSDIYLSANNGLAVQIKDMAGPAVVQALTAGTKRIRLAFSEKVNTSGWPTSATTEVPLRFKWFVGTSYFDTPGTQIYYTALSPARRDSVIYLNHTGLAWTKNDSGAINFTAQTLVFDFAATPNGNMQYDNDLSLNAPTRALLGSDVKVSRDNIAPILLKLLTEDLNKNGKIDHYRFLFDDLSPIYPRRSFKPSFWSITGYDGLKSNLQVDMNVYNPLHMFHQPTAINAFGDTVEVWIKFNETTGIGPALTPYGGDTGDVPDVVVTGINGFTDWADNAMASLGEGLTIEADHAGPVMMFARTNSRTQVEVLMSEDLLNASVYSSDFNLNMAPYSSPTIDQWPLWGWPLTDAVEVNAGKVLINTAWQFAWDPKDEGYLRFAGPGVVDDLVLPIANGNPVTDSIKVFSNTASLFEVRPVLPGSQVRGVPFEVEVIARDLYGNIDRNFKEWLSFSANVGSNQISLPAGSQKLAEGIGRFKVTCWITTEDLKISVFVPNDQYPVDGNTSDAISVINPTIDEPDTLIVHDFPSDQGGKVTLIWPYSQNQMGMGQLPIINHYEIFWKFRDSDSLHHYYGNVFAYDVTGLSSNYMTVDIDLDYSDTTTFYVRAVWVSPVTSMKYGNQIAAASEGGDDFVVAHDYDQGSSFVMSTQTLLSSAGDAVVSGSAIGVGRAIDNFPPMAPAGLYAERLGNSVKLHWPKVTRGVNGMLERLNVIKYEIFAHDSKAYFNPDVEGTLLAAISDTAFMINNGGLRQFYVVRAADTDNKSALSQRVGKYGFTLVTAEKAKYNYLSLPLETAISNAKEMAKAVGTGIKVVLKLQASTNGFSTFYLPDLDYPLPPFAVHSGMPILVQADQEAPASWFYTGDVPPEQSLQFILSKLHKSSYNEIILPMDKTAITDADQLAQDIGGVEVVLKIGPDGKGFSQYWLPSIQYGNPTTPFTIQPGEAVLIQINNSAPSVWPTYSN